MLYAYTCTPCPCSQCYDDYDNYDKPTRNTAIYNMMDQVARTLDNRLHLRAILDGR